MLQGALHCVVVALRQLYNWLQQFGGVQATAGRPAGQPGSQLRWQGNGKAQQARMHYHTGESGRADGGHGVLWLDCSRQMR